MPFWVWFAIAGVFLFLEILTTNFIFLSFALAGAMGLFINILGGNALLQILAAAVFSVISLVFLRPIGLQFLYRRSSESKSWVEKMAGSEAVTLTEITSTSGRIRLHAETWSATTEGHALVIAENTPVTVLRLEGAVAVVQQIHPNTSTNGETK